MEKTKPRATIFLMKNEKLLYYSMEMWKTFCLLRFYVKSIFNYESWKIANGSFWLFQIANINFT